MNDLKLIPADNRLSTGIWSPGLQCCCRRDRRDLSMKPPVPSAISPFPAPSGQGLEITADDERRGTVAVV